MSARDVIRKEGIRLRKGLYRGVTWLAVLLEMKEDQHSEVESVNLKGSSGADSAIKNKLLVSKGSNVEHTSQFDVEGWLLVANAERGALTVGKESSDVGNMKTEKGAFFLCDIVKSDGYGMSDIEKNRRASF